MWGLSSELWWTYYLLCTCIIVNLYILFFPFTEPLKNIILFLLTICITAAQFYVCVYKYEYVIICDTNVAYTWIIYVAAPGLG